MDNNSSSLKIAFVYIAIFLLVILIAIPPIFRIAFGDNDKTADTSNVKNKISTISSKAKSLKSGETAKKSKSESSKGEKKYYIEKFIVNADMSDSDSISRLMKLLDELDSPETAPEPA